MSSPNMSTLTSSLERSLQNCSLNNQHSSGSSCSSGDAAARGSDSPPPPTRALELNSEAPLPYHWEQCLDLKSGEVYYINWRTGMRATEDPRKTAQYSGEYYSEDDSSSYDSDGSSSPSSSSSRQQQQQQQWSGNQENYYYQDNRNGAENNINPNSNYSNNNNSSSSSNVLVVAGCKSCFMYYMVPKHLGICPKCCGQLLHFDRSENASS